MRRNKIINLKELSLLVVTLNSPNCRHYNNVSSHFSRCTKQKRSHTKQGWLQKIKTNREDELEYFFKLRSWRSFSVVLRRSRPLASEHETLVRTWKQACVLVRLLGCRPLTSFQGLFGEFSAVLKVSVNEDRWMKRPKTHLICTELVCLNLE